MKDVVVFIIAGMVTYGVYNFSLLSPDSHALPEERDILRTAEIIRDNNNKEAYLHIRTEGKWRLFAGPSVEEIDMSAPLLKGERNGAFRLKLPKNRRSYFLFLSDKENLVLAERNLPVTGGYNLRDLGGYETKDGRNVKWGKFFRSDDLSTLTEDDRKYLSAIPIRSVVDFRSEKEIRQAPDRLPEGVYRYFVYSVKPESFTAAEEMAGLSNPEPTVVDSLLRNTYTQWVTDPESIQSYKKFFALLQEKEELPLLFHCSAGKDETGIAAALLLYALGVREEIILQDYLLSNQHAGEKYASYVEQYPALKPVFEVKPVYLESGIDTIRKKYGSVEAFLTRELDVDLLLFRDKYLF